MSNGTQALGHVSEYHQNKTFLYFNVARIVFKLIFMGLIGILGLVALLKRRRRSVNDARKLWVKSASIWLIFPPRYH